MSVVVALRVMLAGVCCLGIWLSWKTARADFLFQQDSPESVRAATHLLPDEWRYYMRLAQLDRAQARELLSTALRLNRYNAQASIELALQDESEGDTARAEKLLLNAFEVDRTYVPRWSLANFYFRRDKMPEFWIWAHKAAEMPADNIGPLFELCWHVSPDAQKIAEALLNDNPDLIRPYIGFLLTKDELTGVAAVVPSLIRVGQPDTDRDLMFTVVNRLTNDHQDAAANTVWHLLIDRRWVIADATMPNNGEFRREPLPVAFDWDFPEYPGLHSWPGSTGLETEFSGGQPENCAIAEQTIYLAPGDYTMQYYYHTTDIAPDTGIKWQIVDPAAKKVLAESPSLSSDMLKQTRMTFSIPQGTSLVRLRLAYERAIGTPRITGTLLVLSNQIQAHPQT